MSLPLSQVSDCVSSQPMLMKSRSKQTVSKYPPFSNFCISTGRFQRFLLQVNNCTGCSESQCNPHEPYCVFRIPSLHHFVADPFFLHLFFYFTKHNATYPPRSETRKFPDCPSSNLPKSLLPFMVYNKSHLLKYFIFHYFQAASVV